MNKKQKKDHYIRDQLLICLFIFIVAIALFAIFSHSNTQKVYIPKIVMYVEELPCPTNATFSCTHTIITFSPERDELAYKWNYTYYIPYSEDSITHEN